MNDKDVDSHTSPQVWEKLNSLAQQQRRVPTAAELLLWRHLRARKLHRAKFRRQYAMDRFIVDFICLKAHLIVEVDGPIHDYTDDEDRLRQAWLEAKGFTVLRFSNDDVLLTIGAVLKGIGELLPARAT